MKNSELLQQQSNVEEQDKQVSSKQPKQENTELIKKWDVNNTPFTVVAQEHNGNDVHFLVMGKYRLTEAFNTIEELTEYTGIEQVWGENGMTFEAYTKWAFLTSVISAIVEETIKLKEQNQLIGR